MPFFVLKGLNQLVGGSSEGVPPGAQKFSSWIVILKSTTALLNYFIIFSIRGDSKSCTALKEFATPKIFTQTKE